jgi:hypothetical protein
VALGYAAVNILAGFTAYMFVIIEEKLKLVYCAIPKVGARIALRPSPQTLTQTLRSTRAPFFSLVHCWDH